jgi:hypothetical protein
MWYQVVERRSGGAKGSRTPDLLNAIQALSQLSYGPAPWEAGRIASDPTPRKTGPDPLPTGRARP